MLIIPALLHLLFIDSLTVSPKTLSCMRSIVDEFLVFFFTEDTYVHWKWQFLFSLCSQTSYWLIHSGNHGCDTSTSEPCLAQLNSGGRYEILSSPVLDNRWWCCLACLAEVESTDKKYFSGIYNTLRLSLYQHKFILGKFIFK